MTLLLDPQIRDWVLLPIVIITLLVGVCRTLLVQLVASGPGKVDTKEMKHKQRLARSTRMRQNGHVIDSQSIAMRVVRLCDSIKKNRSCPDQCVKLSPTLLDSHDAFQNYFTHPETGIFTDKNVKKPVAMPDMDKMMGPMKTQMITMVPMYMMISFVQYFFAGFIVVKVPFPAPTKWKTMFQRGIDITYFLVMFGIRAVMGLILSPQAASQMQNDMMMQAQMGMGQQQGPQQFDPKTKYDQETKNVCHYASAHKKRMVVPKAITRLVNRIRATGGTGDI